MRKLKNKKNRKDLLLSIVVAIILRAYITTNTNPTVSKTFRNIPLVINDDDLSDREGYKLAEEDGQYVTVKLSSRRNEMANLTEDDIAASVKIIGGKEGIETCAVDVDVPNGVKIDDVEPKSLNFRVEKRISKSFPIDIDIDDSLKDGKIIDLVKASDKTVTVEGLRSNVDSVKRVVAIIDDDKYLNGNENQISIRPIDVDGNEVKEVSLSKKEIKVQYDVLASKEVPVKLRLRGNFPDDVKLLSSSRDPQVVMIKGKEADLEKIDSVETLPIYVDNVKKSLDGTTYLKDSEKYKPVKDDIKITYRLEVDKR